jgi:hypothetical protein
MKITTRLNLVAIFVAAGLVTSRAQILTPVGVSQTDPTAVNPIVAGLTDVALGTSATGTVPVNEVTNYGAIPYYATLGGPGVATATADTSIGGTLFGPLGAIDGIIRIDNPANWGGVAYDPNFNPWLPVDYSESGTTQTTPPIQPPDWLLVDFNGAHTVGMIVIEGRFNDRTFGGYTFQYSTDPSPLTTNSTWTTIGTFGWMPPTSFGVPVVPRLAFAFPPIANVTGIIMYNQPTNANGIWGCSVQQLEVYPPFTSAPVITQQPQGTNAIVGLNLVLSVTANNGTGFQWYKNGVPVGPNNNVYDVSASAQTIDSGTYTVVVTNSVGPVTSAPAVVNISNPATPTLMQSSAVTLSYAGVPGYQFALQSSPIVNSTFTTFANSGFGVSSNWSTIVTGQTLTATPIVAGNQFFKLKQTSP